MADGHPHPPAGLVSSLAERAAHLAPGKLEQLFEGLTDRQIEALLYDWKFWARPSQVPPAGEWLCWLVLAGRGFGKTRMGAEWIRQNVEGPTPLAAPPAGARRIALIAQTFADARDVMLEGDSGIFACAPRPFRPAFEPSRRRLIWPNGVQGFLYSSEEPDQLRGPQHHLAWGDELAKWRHAETAWTNLLLGLRLGLRPRVMATTTPRPSPLIERLRDDPATAVTGGNTFENAANLSRAFLQHIKRLYDGTRLGRQEIFGEILQTVEGALWTRETLERHRVAAVPELARVVVAVDPPVSQGEHASACGIVAAGRDGKGEVYVLADLSLERASPNLWGSRAVQAFHDFEADRLVAEVNNGGDLVEALVRQLDASVSYRAVRASRGKMIRAEPVAALYERGLVHHAGNFRELEDELCSFTGALGEKSPDRLDALVWAVTELALKGEAEPRIRRM